MDPMKPRKYTILLILFLIIALEFTLILHHHDGGQDPLHCAVCHWVKRMVLALPWVVGLVLIPIPSRSYLFPSQKRFVSTLVPLKLRNRPPPFFS